MLEDFQRRDCQGVRHAVPPCAHAASRLTGRILSEGPCVSNISKPYRAAVREDGYQFIYFDFRNFELRVQASLAKDPVLMELFNNDFDLHAFTASLILDKDPVVVTPDERKKYKSISLGYWYGMGVAGIVYRTGLDREFIRNVTQALDQKFSVLRSHVSSFEKEASEKGVAETPWGRRMAKKAKYGFWALLAQATAADYFKYTLTQVAKELPDLILLAPLFDGGLFKIQDNHRDIANTLENIADIASQPVEGFCMMGVDVGSGNSWQEAVQSSKGKLS